jgi:hypothetical protein
MSEKIKRIDGKDHLFRSTAATPRRYRNKFHSDMMRDLYKLSVKAQALDDDDPENQLDIIDMELCENIAYIMCADENKPDTVEAWLDQFGDAFAAYDMLEDIFDLWSQNVQVMNPEADPNPEAKKK